MNDRRSFLKTMALAPALLVVLRTGRAEKEIREAIEGDIHREAPPLLPGTVTFCPSGPQYTRILQGYQRAAVVAARAEACGILGDTAGV